MIAMNPTRNQYKVLYLVHGEGAMESSLADIAFRPLLHLLAFFFFFFFLYPGTGTASGGDDTNASRSSTQPSLLPCPCSRSRPPSSSRRQGDAARSSPPALVADGAAAVSIGIPRRLPRPRPHPKTSDAAPRPPPLRCFRGAERSVVLLLLLSSLLGGGECTKADVCGGHGMRGRWGYGEEEEIV